MTTAELEASSVQCQQCGAQLALRRFDKAVACPYCQSTNVVRRLPRPGIPTPAFVLGFARPKAEVRALVARWGRTSPWYAPRGFKHLEVELLKPVYLPAYLVTGEVDCRWSARAGYTYQEKQGKRTVTKTEWHDVGATTLLRLLPVLISASYQVKNDELQAIEPYDFGRVARYSEAALSGWPAEEAARTPEGVTPEVQQEVGAQLTQRIAALVPGERKSAPSIHWTMRDTHVDLVLVPVWTMLVRFSPTRPRVRVLVNGQTGKVHGKVPVSAVKVTLAILAALAALALLVLFFKHGGRR